MKLYHCENMKLYPPDIVWICKRPVQGARIREDGNQGSFQRTKTKVLQNLHFEESTKNWKNR